MRTAVAAAMSLVVLTAACGADPDRDAEPAGKPWPPVATAPAELDADDLEEALIEIDDIPRSHGTAFVAFVLDEEALPGGDDVIAGGTECGDYLDDEFGAAPLASTSVSYADPDSGVSILQTVELYERGDAGDELDEIRHLVTACDRFRMVQGADELEVDLDLAELSETPGYEDLGDDGLRVGLLVIVEGVPFRATARTIIRVGDVIGTMSIEAFADFGQDPSPELTALMTERLRELVEGAA